MVHWPAFSLCWGGFAGLAAAAARNQLPLLPAVALYTEDLDLGKLLNSLPSPLTGQPNFWSAAEKCSQGDAIPLQAVPSSDEEDMFDLVAQCGKGVSLKLQMQCPGSCPALQTRGDPDDDSWPALVLYPDRAEVVFPDILDPTVARGRVLKRGESVESDLTIPQVDYQASDRSAVKSLCTDWKQVTEQSSIMEVAAAAEEIVACGRAALPLLSEPGFDTLIIGARDRATKLAHLIYGHVQQAPNSDFITIKYDGVTLPLSSDWIAGVDQELWSNSLCRMVVSFLSHHKLNETLRKAAARAVVPDANGDEIICEVGAADFVRDAAGGREKQEVKQTLQHMIQHHGLKSWDDLSSIAGIYYAGREDLWKIALEFIGQAAGQKREVSPSAFE